LNQLTAIVALLVNVVGRRATFCSKFIN